MRPDKALRTLGQRLQKQAVRSAVRKCQRLPGLGLKGDLHPKNIWDDICIIARELVIGDLEYDAADTTLRQMVREWLSKRHDYEKAALWSIAEVAELREEDGPDDDALVEELTGDVWALAIDYENERIRRYIDG